MSKSAASDGFSAANGVGDSAEAGAFTWVEIERLDGTAWRLFADGSFCPAW